MRGGLTPSHQNFIKYETLQESDNLDYISRLILTVLQKDLQIIISLLNILVEYCPEKCIAYMKKILAMFMITIISGPGAHTGSEERGEMGVAVFVLI